MAFWREGGERSTVNLTWLTVDRWPKTVILVILGVAGYGQVLDFTLDFRGLGRNPFWRFQLNVWPIDPQNAHPETTKGVKPLPLVVPKKLHISYQKNTSVS